jgi:hypothetical protein
MIAEACFLGLTGGSNLKSHDAFEHQSAFSDTLFPPKLFRNQMARIYEKIKEYVSPPSVQLLFYVSLQEIIKL